ncbi:kinesin-related protein 8-like [Durio zibethinus]|uniref:Kinesin-related protein 8-like n=1 Tax=Durio zibethinus TaxID=66656 RepID=A0A6P5XZY5_DURZI|nr:kinesin-related protein 8-like [Durio zibethinus]XP_022733310.1 kinesin-related protein 8-like [Durio zibethinus]XP_022733312.1 kinesin-related protein 8-like [Durio zibethinus]XP_022733313.1 kinesin-related protein 8-like [Durio zibethinus]XP_022733314.1 kinesin-related protein 8-like [Durio zibethinus]XP_022733315.1 kinesin-related protein 8-like [Durio zibethinus]XP_022733316.1 kinesin-related protein 8-like [Durio zibethinus]XP_022733317.1 kinesin-related protein 8-like [Durio zibethi
MYTMKHDNDQVLCHSTIGYKSDSRPYSFLADTKPFENKEKPLDSTVLNAEGIVKENNPTIYLENTRNGWPASKLDYSMSVNDFVNGNEKEFRDFVTSNTHSSKNMDSFQESVFYLDKSVMECQLPELVVCYKESTYNVVKDICIDEGVPTQDKFLFDSGVDVKSDYNFPPSEKDQDSKLMKEKLEIDMSLQVVYVSPEENQYGKDIDDECGSNKKLDADTRMRDISFSLEENESNKGIPNQYDSKDLMLTREMKDDAMKVVTDDVSKELFTLGELLSMPELSAVKSKAMSSDCKSDGVEQQSFQNSSEKEVMVTPPLVSAAEESYNSSEEAILSAPALVSAAEESDSGKGEATLISPAQASASEESTSCSLVNEVSSDSKLETGSITVDYDSSAPTSSKDECPHNLDHGPLETGSTPKLEDTADQPFSNNLQRGNGESSFSASGPVTGLISYSGPIAYSGSLSLRSDSSTTSTRSFAFPILQSEWNSSPVRMAKADRRHYQKHRCWRQGLLCCRF